MYKLFDHFNSVNTQDISSENCYQSILLSVQLQSWTSFNKPYFKITQIHIIRVLIKAMLRQCRQRIRFLRVYLKFVPVTIKSLSNHCECLSNICSLLFPLRYTNRALRNVNNIFVFASYRIIQEHLLTVDHDPLI